MIRKAIEHTCLVEMFKKIPVQPGKQATEVRFGKAYKAILVEICRNASWSHSGTGQQDISGAKLSQGQPTILSVNQL